MILLAINIYETGPYIFPVMLAVLIVLAVISGWLIDAGMARRGWRRWVCLGIGVPIGFIVAAACVLAVLA